MMGSNLTFRHGVITTESASGKILIQNYSNLKLKGVTLKGGPHTAYTLSNNNGNVTIGAGTNIYAGGAGPKAAFDVCRFADYESVVVTVEKGAGLSNNNGNVTIGAGTNIYAGGAGPKAAFDVCRFADYESVVVTVEKGAGEIVGVIETSVSGGATGYAGGAGPKAAFDVCRFADYESVVVTVEKGAGEIVGVIETSVSGGATGKGPIGLNINGGNLSKASLVCDGESAETIKVVKDPYVALAAPDGHEWVGGTLVKPSEKAVAAVVKPSGDVATFAKLADALAAVALAAPDGHEWVGGTLVKPSEKAVAAVVKPSGDVATFAKLADALAARHARQAE